MIFVTTGTHYLPFNRLLKMISFLIDKSFIKEEVIIQSGASNVFVKGAVMVPFLSHEEMLSYLKKARLIVTSAGPATIFQALTYGKNKPLVLARLKKHGEHVSDHQLYFAKFLEKKMLIKLIESNDDLIDFLSGEERINLLLKNSSSKKMLITKLTEYLKLN